VDLTPGGDDAFNLAPALTFHQELAWSPDGQLAFRALVDGRNDIYVWDGVTTINVSQTPDQRETLPAWSSDSKLSFVSYQGDDWRIYVRDGVTQATFEQDYSGEAFYPTWSHDERLAFQTVSDTAADIFVWDERITNISQTPLILENIPIWSADGRLAYNAINGAYSDIFIWNGATITNITNTPTINEVLITWWTP
jgi:WD40 repeat protein